MKLLFPSNIVSSIHFQCSCVPSSALTWFGTAYKTGWGCTVLRMGQYAVMMQVKEGAEGFNGDLLLHFFCTAKGNLS